jgi:hypothetical protein
MIDIDYRLTLENMLASVERLWDIAAPKIVEIDRLTAETSQTPVFTVRGKYQPQGWTEWTQGFQFGAALLQFDATGDDRFLEMGRRNTIQRMASHVTHFGVHDHGFNNVSTYGNLLRLLREGRFDAPASEASLYELALKASGAVQASRWTQTATGDGFIYSFNGPHSLFSDTIRSLRSLALAHQLGHAIAAENDRRISLLDRLVQHARLTATYNVYYGEGRDAFDVVGRVAHESIFNTNDGQYRCPSTQQGYSPFTTWTRGLAWIMLGYAEQSEFIAELNDDELRTVGHPAEINQMMMKAARATCDFYIQNSPTCGVPYWDTGAPGLIHLNDYLDRPADPFNDHEPVDSSAAAIASQGLMRFGQVLLRRGDPSGQRYWSAGLTTLKSLLSPPYIAQDPNHQGLLLHSVYHRPRGWDCVPAGSKIPFGESCMWGDYHLMEASLYLRRMAKDEKYYRFFLDR